MAGETFVNSKIPLSTRSFLPRGSQIETADLPPVLSSHPESVPRDHLPLMVETERALIERALEESNWDKKKAARRLGIGRTTFTRSSRSMVLLNLPCSSVRFRSPPPELCMTLGLAI